MKWSHYSIIIFFSNFSLLDVWLFFLANWSDHTIKSYVERGEQAPTPIVICFRTNQKPYRVLLEIKQLNEIITLHTKRTRETRKKTAPVQTMPLKKRTMHATWKCLNYEHDVLWSAASLMKLILTCFLLPSSFSSNAKSEKNATK